MPGLPGPCSTPRLSTAPFLSPAPQLPFQDNLLHPMSCCSLPTPTPSSKKAKKRAALTDPIGSTPHKPTLRQAVSCRLCSWLSVDTSPSLGLAERGRGCVPCSTLHGPGSTRDPQQQLAESACSRLAELRSFPSTGPATSLRPEVSHCTSPPQPGSPSPLLCPEVSINPGCVKGVR